MILLVERLLAQYAGSCDKYDMDARPEAAERIKALADRIEALEAALMEIRRTAKNPDHDLLLRLRFIVKITRTALEERK